MEQSKFYQIKNITEQEYTLVGYDDSVITCPIQDVDRLASAFTIQDAKDNDVLALSWLEDKNLWEKIIIFKKYHSEGVKGICSMPCVEGYGNTFKDGKWHSLKKYHIILKHGHGIYIPQQKNNATFYSKK